MALKFSGNYNDLKKCVALTNFGGCWRDLANHQKQYRTDDGAILNWWERSETLYFQGRDQNHEFEKALIASAKNHVEIKAEKAGLRKLIKDAQAEIAKLKWRDLRNETPTIRIMIANRLTDIAKLITRL